MLLYSAAQKNKQHECTSGKEEEKKKKKREQPTRTDSSRTVRFSAKQKPVSGTVRASAASSLTAFRRHVTERPAFPIRQRLRSCFSSFHGRSVYVECVAALSLCLRLNMFAVRQIEAKNQNAIKLKQENSVEGVVVVLAFLLRRPEKKIFFDL